MLLSTLRSSVPESKRAVLEQAQAAVGTAIEELRELMKDYWPRSLKGDDIAQALRQLVDGYRRRDLLDVNFAIVGRLDDLPDMYANMLYGALRELLRNVVKHAGGARCTVALFRASGAIEMRVRDYATDNVLTDEFGNGFGLLSLRERAEALNGTLAITARSNGGTLVTVRIPLEPTARALAQPA
jgi:signal transduction histidine kinase